MSPAAALVRLRGAPSWQTFPPIEGGVWAWEGFQKKVASAAIGYMGSQHHYAHLLFILLLFYYYFYLFFIFVFPLRPVRVPVSRGPRGYFLLKTFPRPDPTDTREFLDFPYAPPALCAPCAPAGLIPLPPHPGTTFLQKSFYENTNLIHPF